MNPGYAGYAAIYAHPRGSLKAAMIEALRQAKPARGRRRTSTDLSDATQTWLNDVARLMNGRPRKTLGWKTPAETMADEITPSG